MLCVITSQPSNKPASQPGTYVCQLAPPDYKFKVKCAHQSILLFPIFLIYVILSKLSPPPKRELNLSKSRTGFSVFFLCLGPICWPPGGLLCSFFASWTRKGTYLCQLAAPHHQLGGKWGHQVDLSPSPGVRGWTTFC